MSEILKDCGYSTSYLPEVNQNTWDSKILWNFLARVVTNPLSIENKIFQDNLSPVLENLQKYREKKAKILAKMNTKSSSNVLNT